MRTEKELWEVVVYNTHRFSSGLCWWVKAMYHHMSVEEIALLEKSLKENLPPKTVFAYCWWPGEIQPRIDWIKKRIEKL